MTKGKQLLLVGFGSLLLAGTAVVLFLLDPSFIPDFYRITSMVITVLWGFFFVPAVLLSVRFLLKKLALMSPEQAYRVGVRFGLILGFGGFLVLCLVLSPVTGTMWYVFTVKDVVKDRKVKKRPPEDDIFTV